MNLSMVISIIFFKKAGCRLALAPILTLVMDKCPPPPHPHKAIGLARDTFVDSYLTTLNRPFFTILSSKTETRNQGRSDSEAYMQHSVTPKCVDKPYFGFLCQML